MIAFFLNTNLSLIIILHLTQFNLRTGEYAENQESKQDHKTESGMIHWSSPHSLPELLFITYWIFSI